MPSIVIASELFGDMFASAPMRALFTDRALVQRYLDIEAALARVQGRLGLIPMQAADAIAAVAQVERVDWERLAERTRVVGYPILPLVEQMSEWAEGGLGQYCHWGATTQDIMDTADALQIRLQGVVLPGIGEIPVQVIQALPYALTVILLAGFVGRAVAPKASGIPYVKDK